MAWNLLGRPFTSPLTARDNVRGRAGGNTEGPPAEHLHNQRFDHLIFFSGPNKISPPPKSLSHIKHFLQFNSSCCSKLKTLSWRASSITVISCPVPLWSTLLVLGEVKSKCLLERPSGRHRRNRKGMKAKAPRTGHPVQLSGGHLSSSLQDGLKTPSF